MATEGYSAGAIFLQVVPVFKDVQNAIKREAKDIDRVLGDQMEKAGERAGDRAGKAAARSLSDSMEKELRGGVADMEKALGGINTKNLGKKLRGEIQTMRKELESLGDVDLKVDDNFTAVSAKVTALRTQIEDMRKRSHVFFDIKGLPDVYRKIAKLEGTIAGINGTVDIDVDTKKAERKIGAFERAIKSAMDKASSHIGDGNKEVRKLRDELDYLSKLRVGIDIGANQLRREVGEIQADLKRLSTQSVDIDARVEAGKAHADLERLTKVFNEIDGKTANIYARANTAHARRELKSMDKDTEAVANSFRGFNAIVLASATAGPALIPVLGAIAGGLLALGPAAAVGVAGLGSVLLGFSGLGDALGALSTQQEQAATTAQTAGRQHVAAARSIAAAKDAVGDAERSAARSAEDAAEAVADARKSAADAIEDALDRQKDAQEAYRDSVMEVKDAEQALREARQNARGSGDDLDRAVRENKLAIDQALLDSFDATVAYNATQTDGSATNAEQEQARINREEALLRLEELRDQSKDLAKEKKKWDKEGVNGTDEVQAAQDNLSAAIDAQRDAYENLRDSAQAVDEARADGAEMVREAIERQNETLSDNARAIADARARLAEARQDAADTYAEVNAQQQAVNTAFDKLGPAGQRFVQFIWSLRDGFYQFRDAVQQAMLPAVQRAIEGFLGSANASKAADAVIALARAFGRFTEHLSKSFQGKVWGDFFQMLARIGPKIARAYGGATIKFFEAFASLLTTLAPFSLRFARGLERMAAGFADWAKSKKGREDVRRFLAYVHEVGPAVRRFFVALVGAVTNLVVALAPYAAVLIAVFTAILEWVADLDPALLGAFVGVVVALVVAMQVATGVVSILATGMAILALKIAAIVFVAVAVVIALIYLYNTSDTARKIMDKAFSMIAAAAKVLWQAAKMYFRFMGRLIGAIFRGIKKVWEKVLKPVFDAIGRVIRWVWNKVIRPIFGWIADKFRALGRGIKMIWDRLISPVWDLWSKVMSKLWNKVLKPIIDWIGDKFSWLGGKIEDVYEKHIAPPLKKIWDKLLPKLQKAFKTSVEFIKDVWDGLKKVIGTPIKFVIEKVINGGLVKGFNKIANFVGSKEMQPLPVPEWGFARGGVMPGYSPGKDVHHFTSPTGGRLHLSGGEAIMRPEWTAAMGPDYVHRMNSIAARGGAQGVRRAMGFASGGILPDMSYWLGGIMPLRNGSSSQHLSGYSSAWAGDFNYPGYSDYGKPVSAWKSGRVAQMNYVGDESYGRWVVLNHGGQSSLYAHLSNFGGIKVGDQVRAGQTVGYVGDLGNTGNPPTSHLHFEINGGSVDESDTSKGGGGWWSKLAGWAKSFFNAPAKWFKERLSGAFESITDRFGDNPMVDMVTGFGRKALDGVIDFVRGLVGETKEKHENDLPIGSGVARFADEVKTALRMLNQPTSLADEVLQRMTQESGGNPRAVNNWDSNAAAGTPSVGLMQVIGPTFAAYAGKFRNTGPFLHGVSLNPLANIFAGLNYALNRYGSIAEPMLQAGGYADGGIYGGEEASYSTGGIADNGTMMYDNGGYLPPGLTTVLNLTGRPEPVFTSQQWNEMSEGGTGGGNIHYEPHFEGSNLTADDVAGDLNFTFRRIKRGGKYAGVGS